MKSIPVSAFGASTLPPSLLVDDLALVDERVERWLAPATLVVVALALLSVLVL